MNNEKTMKTSFYYSKKKGFLKHIKHKKTKTHSFFQTSFLFSKIENNSWKHETNRPYLFYFFIFCSISFFLYFFFKESKKNNAKQNFYLRQNWRNRKVETCTSRDACMLFPIFFSVKEIIPFPGFEDTWIPFLLIKTL